MQNSPDTPDERLQRRRTRRWKRRARVIGPFLGIPLLLLTLTLSVDLIEYQKQPEPDRLSDRPIRMTQPGSTNPIWPSRFSASEFNPEVPNSPEEAAKAEIQSKDLDITLPLPPPSRPPTPPYALYHADS